MIELTRHPTCDLSIGFDPDSHVYKLISDPLMPWEDNNEIYVSGTQFCGHYMPEFNAAAVAPVIAKRQGKKTEDVIAEWDRKRIHSCEMGTRVHCNQELMMKGGQPQPTFQDEREKAIMRNGILAINSIRSAGWEPFAAEKVIFSVKYKIAGTVDAIFVRGREYMIVDWKTNERIEKSNRYGEKCKNPLGHLDACEFVKYSLQLSLYRRILLEEGYLNAIAPVRLVLIHLTPNGFTPMPVTPLEELDSLLLDYLTNWRMSMFNIPF